MTIELVRKTDLQRDNSTHISPKCIDSVLYHLNLLDLQGGAEFDYESRELNRVAQAAQRVKLETHFLKQITNPHREMTRFRRSFENKEALFSSITNYINSKIDNTYVDWFEGHATLEDAKKFVREYGADQVYFTQYLSQLSTIAPERAAVEIYSNLFDETGIDLSNRGSYTFNAFHPELFRRLYKYFSLKNVSRFHQQESINSETFYCINMMLLSIRLGYLQGAGAMFLLESTIPYQLSKINDGFKRLDVPAHERIFLEMHCQLDGIHSQNWWNSGIKEYVQDEYTLGKLLTGIDIAISARNQLWRGLMNQRAT